MLFYSSLLGLAAETSQEVPAPNGLVRSQVVRSASGSCRLALNVAPLAWDASGFPQHVAFSTDDVAAVARRAVDRGLVPLAIPQNYYDDLMARFDLAAPEVETMAALGLLHDRDASGDFTHFYTATIGGDLLRGGPATRGLRRVRRDGRRRPAGRAASPRGRLTPA